MDMQLDLKGLDAALETMEEIVEYAQCVAGCIGEMCVRVVLGRCGFFVPSLEEMNLKRTINLDKETMEPLGEDDVTLLQRPEGSISSASRATARYLIHHARRMGVSLQLVNIARDVVDDSVKLRRCYLPRELIERNEPAQPILQALFTGKVSSDTKGNKGTISPASLRPYCLQLLRIASSLYTASFPSIQALSSKPTQSGLRAACAVYFAISQSILEQSEEEIRAGKRARMSKWRRAFIATKAVYLERG
jgi:15-cis-phytoene synthase/lycopene beta-cyclase